MPRHVQVTPLLCQLNDPSGILSPTTLLWARSHGRDDYPDAALIPIIVMLLPPIVRSASLPTPKYTLMSVAKAST